MKKKKQFVVLGLLAVSLLGVIGCKGGSAGTQAEKPAKKARDLGVSRADSAAFGEEEHTKELEDVLPFMQYVPFEVTAVYGFRDPMKPLIVLDPTATPLIGEKLPEKTEVEPLPAWCNLTGIIWDNANPAASVAVFTDPKSNMSVSGCEGEVILPVGAGAAQEVLLRTIYPSGVMVEYKSNEFNLILHEEDQYHPSISKGKTGKRPVRRGGRR